MTRRRVRGRGRPLAFLCRSPRRERAGGRLRAVAVGLPMCLVGVVLIPTPLPGALPLGAGMALLASEFRILRRAAVRAQVAWRSAERGRPARSGAGPLGEAA